MSTTPITDENVLDVTTHMAIFTTSTGRQEKVTKYVPAYVARQLECALAEAENKVEWLQLNNDMLTDDPAKPDAAQQLADENFALRDATASLRDFIERKRHDPENIAKIINGALRITPLNEP